jgi:DNA-directed RNA polymerase subunit RPC12/RpoP
MMTRSSTGTCSTCGRTFPSTALDLTADGARCFTCGQAAAVAQFHVDRAAAIASHNRSVLVGSGFQFWRIQFACTACSTPIESAPPLLGLASPPVEIACEKCGTKFAVTRVFRAAWFTSLYGKLLFPIGLLSQRVPLGAAIAAHDGAGIASVVLLAFGATFIASVLLAVPAAVFTARRRTG